jgi:hypothetical protein
MVNTVRLAILLYLSLLCGVQPGHAYDTRLSSLADNPFPAVNLTLNWPTTEAITEHEPDHEPALASVYEHRLAISPTERVRSLFYTVVSQYDLTIYARGPPAILHC